MYYCIWDRRFYVSYENLSFFYVFLWLGVVELVGGANDRHGIETFPTGIRGGDGKRVVENTALGGDDGLELCR